MTEFTAKPLPNMNETPRLPPRPPTTTTKTEPFTLMIEDRVQMHLARLNEKVSGIHYHMHVYHKYGEKFF